MEKRIKKITALIPCFNEENGIASVINSFPVTELQNFGFSLQIIVIDNNSTDKTVEVALANGATVLLEKKRGKGNAMRKGFNNISGDTDYVVMLDGDNTYDASEILRLIEPLEKNFCDVIVGSRLGGKMQKDALKLRNRIVNWVFTFLVRQFYKANVTDVLSGYFAWKKEALDTLKRHITSEGFAIEMEMIVKMVKLGLGVYSVPISYNIRVGETKISAISDGFKILWTFAKHLPWTPKQIDGYCQGEIC